MRDFYRTHQGEEESVTSYAVQVEGLLSQIRDKFPDQIPLENEQELLKDRLSNGSHKSIWDSVKYHHADAKVDYMTFLAESRKEEDKDRIGQSKIKGKLKAAAATIPSTQSDAIIKRLKKTTSNRHFGGHNENITNFTICPGLNIFQAGKPFLWDEGERKEPLH